MLINVNVNKMLIKCLPTKKGINKKLVFVDSLFGWFHSSQFFFSGFFCYMILNSEIMLTACDDGEPSATESTRRKAFSFEVISKMQRLSLRNKSLVLSNELINVELPP